MRAVGRGSVVTLIIYDIPVKYTSVNGYGVQPSSPRRVIRKFIDAGMVERLQDSVLLVHDERAIKPIVDAILAYGGHVLVIRGVMEEYGKPIYVTRLNRISPGLGDLHYRLVEKSRKR